MAIVASSPQPPKKELPSFQQLEEIIESIFPGESALVSKFYIFLKCSKALNVPTSYIFPQPNNLSFINFIISNLHITLPWQSIKNIKAACRCLSDTYQLYSGLLLCSQAKLNPEHSFPTFLLSNAFPGRDLTQTDTFCQQLPLSQCYKLLFNDQFADQNISLPTEKPTFPTKILFEANIVINLHVSNLDATPPLNPFAQQTVENRLDDLMNKIWQINALASRDCFSNVIYIPGSGHGHGQGSDYALALRPAVIEAATLMGYTVSVPVNHLGQVVVEIFHENPLSLISDENSAKANSTRVKDPLSNIKNSFLTTWDDTPPEKPRFIDLCRQAANRHEKLRKKISLLSSSLGNSLYLNFVLNSNPKANEAPGQNENLLLSQHEDALGKEHRHFVTKLKQFKRMMNSETDLYEEEIVAQLALEKEAQKDPKRFRDFAIHYLSKAHNYVNEVKPRVNGNELKSKKVWVEFEVTMMGWMPDILEKAQDLYEEVMTILKQSAPNNANNANNVNPLTVQAKVLIHCCISDVLDKLSTLFTKSQQKDPLLVDFRMVRYPDIIGIQNHS